MAHLEHYKQSDVRRLMNEHERNGGYTDRDKHIDTARTSGNYTMERSKGCLVEILRERLSQVPHAKRKDLNVLSEWVVTLPSELKGNDRASKQFFEMAYAFTQDRYGADNVLQGYVHRDETSDHIHICLIPYYEGPNGPTVSSKKRFTRMELSSYQRDLDKQCEKVFGLPGLILNGRTKGGYTTKELKERTRREKELRDREKDLHDAETALNASKNDLAAEKAEFIVKREKWLKTQNTALDELEEYEQALEERRQELDERESRLQNREDMLNTLELSLQQRESRVKDDERYAKLGREAYRRQAVENIEKRGRDVDLSVSLSDLLR